MVQNIWQQYYKAGSKMNFEAVHYVYIQHNSLSRNYINFTSLISAPKFKNYLSLTPNNNKVIYVNVFE